MATAKYGVINNWALMEEQMIFYRDHLDIFIEDAFPPVRLTRQQHVVARQFGRCDDMRVVCSRGFGKTWLTALCCFAACCLYPGTLVAVCSGTAAQAALVFGKLKLLVDQNPNMAAELQSGSARSLVQLSKDKGKCMFKNGSSMESFAMESMRGQRAKIVVVDEAAEVDQNELLSIVSPIKNYRRDISYNYDFKDFPSKTISITSACAKANNFYADFLRVTKDMGKGHPGSFTCALDWKAAVANGITDADFFAKERARMPASVFDTEYNSIFVGGSNNSVFPYTLVQECRSLEHVEWEQPKNSQSRYVVSLDIATSEAQEADNAVICVVKFTEKSDGSFTKKLVYMRSFHGSGLDVLSQEMRKVYHLQFPNAERLIFDARGLGDSFPKFMDEPWLDPRTGKEYPPLVCDDDWNLHTNAKPILHAVRANLAMNQRMVMSLRTALEKRTLELPIASRQIQAQKTGDNEGKPLHPRELAIYVEADALQFELGTIVQKVSASGNYLYDTQHSGQHKDRYSALAMALDYISLLEEENIRRVKRGPMVVGIASYF